MGGGLALRSPALRDEGGLDFSREKIAKREIEERPMLDVNAAQRAGFADDFPNDFAQTDGIVTGIINHQA